MTRFASNVAETQRLEQRTRAQFFQPLTVDGTPGGASSLAVDGARTVYVEGRKSIHLLRFVMADNTALANGSLGADATPSGTLDVRVTANGGVDELIDLGAIGTNNHFGALFQDEAVGLIGGTWHMAGHLDFVKLFGEPLVLLAGHRLQVSINETNSGLVRFEFFAAGNKI